RGPSFFLPGTINRFCWAPPGSSFQRMLECIVFECRDLPARASWVPAFAGTTVMVTRVEVCPGWSFQRMLESIVFECRDLPAKARWG
ncbi:MAG: hypothetical protein KA738_05565, partial [Pseudoxanthomonas sp.]|nr:hypothetical protein [Pseudoxanthomonas sp.]